MSSEAKVGVLFFLGLALIATFVFFFSNALRGHGAYVVHFQRIVRLEIGDPVTYNGVKVGTVTGVRPILDARKVPQVEIQYSVDRTYRDSVLIGPDSEFRIDQGLLGGSAMAIVSQSGDPIDTVTAKGDQSVPHGIDPVSIDQTLSAIKRILDENRDDIRGTVKGARVAVEHVGQMSEQIRDMVMENRSQVQKTLLNVGDMTAAVRDLVRRNNDNISDALANIKSLAKRLDGMIAENREHVQEMISNFARAGENVAKASNTLDATVDENRVNLKKAIDGLGAVGARLDRIGANVELITGQIAAGRGTIGKLVMDDKLHDKALQAVSALNQRMEELKPLTGPLAALKLYGGVESGFDARTSVTDSYAYLRIEPRPWKFYQGGVSYRTTPKGRIAATEDQNKLNIDFNILLGWRFLPDDRDEQYHLTVAAGLIDSQIGGYVETPILDKWLKLRVMARGKDRSRAVTDRRYEAGNVLVRAYLEADFYHNRLGITVGGNDLSDRPGLWLGVRGEILDNDLRNITSLASFAP